MNICEHCKKPMEFSYFPTEKEKEIINFVLENQLNDKKTPTYREIMAHVGLKSTSSIYQYMQKLKRGGFITVDTAKHRSITILKRPD